MISFLSICDFTRSKSLRYIINCCIMCLLRKRILVTLIVSSGFAHLPYENVLLKKKLFCELYNSFIVIFYFFCKISKHFSSEKLNMYFHYNTLYGREIITKWKMLTVFRLNCSQVGESLEESKKNLLLEHTKSNGQLLLEKVIVF